MFVDARRTARNSTAREVAREINAPYDTITFWLPSGNERGLSVKEWEGQIIAVAERVAQNRKSVVFVAADDNFAEAFMNVLPQIARRGIRLVPITHL
jgi:precorrin-2 methylase